MSLAFDKAFNSGFVDENNKDVSNLGTIFKVYSIMTLVEILCHILNPFTYYKDDNFFVSF